VVVVKASAFTRTLVMGPAIARTMDLSQSKSNYEHLLRQKKPIFGSEIYLMLTHMPICSCPQPYSGTACGEYGGECDIQDTCEGGECIDNGCEKE
jgi:hypothetical protein